MIQFNEESIWAGPPYPVVKKNISEETAEIRKLLFEGEYFAAQQKQAALMAPRISPRSYQTMGLLELDFPINGNVTQYQRALDLNTAITTTKFQTGGVNYRRELLSSAVDDVVVLRISADKKQSISFQAKVNRDGKFELNSIDDATIAGVGQAEHRGKHLGVKFASVYHVVNEGGSVTSKDGMISVKDADTVTLYVACNTDYNRGDTKNPLTDDLLKKCLSQIKDAQSKTYAVLKSDAVEDYQSLFQRVELTLGDRSELDTLTRLNRYKNKSGADPGLEALYFHYGRYLLISSSRQGCLPANLQGIWCKDMAAPWNSDNHININAQMNYWPAEVTNLPECHLPFLDFIERLVPSGQGVAKDLYGCRGFLAGHATDAWLFATPFGKPQYGQWVIGGAWCTQHLMEHYRFTKDETFLREKAYPILKQASLFFLDWLVEHPETGQLVSGPSTSPENKFIDPSTGKKTNISMGPAMDQQVIWDVFTNTLDAAKLLGIEDDFTKQVAEALGKLAGPKVGSDGRLMEWCEEFKEPDAGHRHISHLFGLYPGHQFSEESTPELMAAGRESIDTRLANGGGHTGWSRAWIINFWARFKEPEKAHENIVMLLKKSTHNNLFDKHPPFQIDGNFGGTAGIAEMLIQSHSEYIDLLPTLPKAWPTGHVKGLCARGGFEVEMSWVDGELAKVRLLSKHGLPCKVRFEGKTLSLDTEAGQYYELVK